MFATTARKTLLTTQKRTFMFMLNPIKTRAPIRTTRGIERGNNPIFDTGVPLTKPFGDLFQFIGYNSFLRLTARRALFITACAGVFLLSLPPYITDCFDPSIQQRYYKRYEERLNQFKPAPFVRPEANQV